MDREQPLVGQLQHDHLEEVAGPSGADDQNFGRIRLPVDIDDDKGMVGGVLNVSVGDAVAAGGPVYLHTPFIVLQNDLGVGDGHIGMEV